MNDLTGYNDFFKINNIGFLTKETGIGVYDFNFRNYFDVTSIYSSQEDPVILRIGAINDFEKVKAEVESIGSRLLYTYENYLNATDFERWYPLIKDITPRSKVYDEFPDIEEILIDFDFPFFMKGSRQINRHQRKLSIIENEQMYYEVRDIWREDNILHWQKIVVREYVQLDTIDDKSFPDMIPISREFRVFAWKKKIVGIGKYWTMGPDYSVHDKYENWDLVLIAENVAARIDTPFLAVDIAKTVDGEYIVIEVNDGQESGYAGNDPYVVWGKIIEIEKMLNGIFTISGIFNLTGRGMVFVINHPPTCKVGAVFQDEVGREYVCTAIDIFHSSAFDKDHPISFAFSLPDDYDECNPPRELVMVDDGFNTNVSVLIGF